MSNKPGRNDPCPCGSGKKYKRCCLPSDEAARRERAQQQALFVDDASGDPELDADDLDEEFLDIEDVPRLDVHAITRVRYTRGFVHDLSDLGSGRGVQVTVWEAPRIPPELLETIEREAVDSLEGEWGDPEAADPILLHLRASAAGSPAYWLDLEAKAEGRLEALDSVFRRVWLECCGHLSAFRIGAVTYFSRGYELGGGRR